MYLCQTGKQKRKQEMALKRLTRELQALQQNPSETITAGPIDSSDIYKWHATLIGPPDTPYAGGLFRLKIDFPADFPNKPPTVVFTTRVYHPSVNENGGICLDLLKDAWNPATSITNVLNAVLGLMQDPTGNDKPLMAVIAEEARANPEQFSATAKEWTAKYAK